ncbi:GIN domain-containing protein [Gillisia sp. Hel_I_86]|uniref:GIN domain-containing protein n=1 Tax=Gillisia sp. Hel_I_86 TaxID=1249981 RepID=UPI001646FE0D|nr:DUF2807 domain-containing protein [Gillisia sp. Hel_I_86]
MDKVKGDKDVVSVTNSIDEEFHVLEVNNNLKVTVAQSNKNSYVLTTDKNLADVVSFDVHNGVLKIYTTAKITGSKKLEVFLSAKGISEIILNDDAEVESRGTLSSDMFSLVGKESSKFDLDINTKNTSMILSKNSGGKLKLKSKEVSFNLGDRSDLKGKLDADNLTAQLSKSAQLDVDGKVNTAVFNLKNSADLKAKKLKAGTASLNASNNTDIYVHATKNLIIDAEGKSKVYVYGNPKIEVKGLTDRSRIIKK